MDAERISDYLHSLSVDDELLNELREYAVKERVPIVRRETESFLDTMAALLKPENTLEIGTAIGYSTIVLARRSGFVTTIENYEKRIPLAKENIKKAGLSDRVKLIEGDAGEVLSQLAAEKMKYGLIFLDAAKGQYSVWLPMILELMEPGSMLIADNVLQDCTVMESRFAVARRDRTTHARMREFLYKIKHDERLTSSVLPLGDGVSVSVYNR